MNTSEEFVETDDYFMFGSGISFFPAIPTVEITVIFSICVLIVMGNIIAITAILSLPGKVEPMDLYVISLSIADLLTGLVVVPISVSAVSDVSSEYRTIFCSISGYLHVTLCAVCMYLFMWMSVDRFLVFHKPLRYDVIQTPTRCKCCVLFSWVMASFLCCPPLLGDSRSHFYEDNFLCMMDFGSVLPYSLTLGSLVLAPSVLTLCYTYYYMFSTSNTIVIEELEHTHTDHITSFLLALMFCLSWTPWGVTCVLECLLRGSFSSNILRFSLLWAGELHAVWTPIVLLLTSARCKTGLRMLCTSSCCKPNQEIPV